MAQIWGGISLEGHTDHHGIANGTMTAVRYQDEILRAIVRSKWALGSGAGQCPMCRQFLDDKGIDAIDWPSRSPVLNPI